MNQLLKTTKSFLANQLTAAKLIVKFPDFEKLKFLGIEIKPGPPKEFYFWSNGKKVFVYGNPFDDSKSNRIFIFYSDTNNRVNWFEINYDKHTVWSSDPTIFCGNDISFDEVEEIFSGFLGVILAFPLSIINNMLWSFFEETVEMDRYAWSVFIRLKGKLDKGLRKELKKCLKGRWIERQ